MHFRFFFGFDARVSYQGDAPKKEKQGRHRRITTAISGLGICAVRFMLQKRDIAARTPVPLSVEHSDPAAHARTPGGGANFKRGVSYHLTTNGNSRVAVMPCRASGRKRPALAGADASRRFLSEDDVEGGGVSLAWVRLSVAADGRDGVKVI